MSLSSVSNLEKDRGISLLGFLILCLLCACGGTTQTKNKKSTISVADDTSVGITSELSLNDTLVVKNKAAVFYEADSLHIEQRKKEIGEEDFYTGADDYLYYMPNSREFLDSMRLPILDARNKKVIRFILRSRAEQIVRVDTLPDLWGVFLFDPFKKPREIDMTSVEEEYSNYFR